MRYQGSIRLLIPYRKNLYMTNYEYIQNVRDGTVTMVWDGIYPRNIALQLLGITDKILSSPAFTLEFAGAEYDADTFNHTFGITVKIPILKLNNGNNSR